MPSSFREERMFLPIGVWMVSKVPVMIEMGMSNEGTKI